MFHGRRLGLKKSAIRFLTHFTAELIVKLLLVYRRSIPEYMCNLVPVAFTFIIEFPIQDMFRLLNCTKFS